MEVLAPPLVLASWARRALSAVIDLLVISFISAPLSAGALRNVFEAYAENRSPAAVDLRTVALVQLLVQVGYMTGMHSWRGSTIGKMAARTVLVRDDGSPVTPPVAFVRAVTLAGIWFISQFVVAPIVVNELRPLWSPQRQTWHDVVAKTVVVVAGQSSANDVANNAS